jgi:hypothetical protein
MLIIMAVEAEELPIAAVGRIVVVVVVLVMDRKLAQFFAVKFASAVGADPGKESERLLAEGLFPLKVIPRCHASLAVGSDSVQRDSTASSGRIPAMGDERAVGEIEACFGLQ